MTAFLAVLAGISALMLLFGVLGFLMMFDDATVSQNGYAWPYLMLGGFIGLVLAGVGALVRWLA